MIKLLVVLTLFILSPAHSFAEEHLRLGVARSIERTGLIQMILPPFEKAHNIKVHVVSTGTRKSVHQAEDGAVDVIIAHKKNSEERLVTEGYGIDRTEFMYNDFVIVGPADDPAGIRGMKSAAGALRKIAQAKATFLSRADDSDIHLLELLLWKQTVIVPKGDWYMEASMGMGEVLMQASYKNAYTISEREMWVLFRKKLNLKILCEGDPAFRHTYSVIAVNPAKHPHVKYELAKKFIAYLTSEEGKLAIRSLKLDGERLFYPLD